MSDFILAGLASVFACIFTNPIEVIKTRIQLQGELAARGTYVKPYKGVFKAFATVVRNDGWMGLQKGFVPATWYQFIIYSFRLSIYNKAEEKKWIQNKKGEEIFLLGLCWGVVGGMVGTFFSSPFYLVKTQLQSKATTKAISVGYQHGHTSMSSAFRKIYETGGIRGLWRGSFAALPRAAIGGGVQIATFAKTKYLLRKYDIIHQKSLNSFIAGKIAGTAMALAMTPSDVIAIRLYNQGLDKNGRGLYYNGFVDCCIKILQTEGLHGLYKGFGITYLRMAPHSALILLFFDELVALRNHLTK